MGGTKLWKSPRRPPGAGADAQIDGVEPLRSSRLNFPEILQLALIGCSAPSRSAINFFPSSTNLEWLEQVYVVLFPALISARGGCCLWAIAPRSFFGNNSITSGCS
ncbi:MAG: hypothetical protein IPG64_22025 [Haliea sp.]|nr:hypothetical protein [Haliea sp.]